MSPLNDFRFASLALTLTLVVGMQEEEARFRDAPSIASALYDRVSAARRQYRV